jgi:hypothetical protein
MVGEAARAAHQLGAPAMPSTTGRRVPLNRRRRDATLEPHRLVVPPPAPVAGAGHHAPTVLLLLRDS